MSLKQYFFPEKLASAESKINSDIQVVNFGGHKRLDMGGLTQSGRIIEDIWRHTFSALLPKKYAPNSVLLLGFGAGSSARLISHKWPQAQITGVELDPAVIKVAKEHFQIDTIPHLKLINANAIDFVNKLNQHYDLALVDCYVGDQFPKGLESLAFYKKLTKNTDHVLINRLFWGKYQKITLEFLGKLQAVYSTKTTRTPSNFLISIT